MHEREIFSRNMKRMNFKMFTIQNRCIFGEHRCSIHNILIWWCCFPLHSTGCSISVTKSKPLQYYLNICYLNCMMQTLMVFFWPKQYQIRIICASNFHILYSISPLRALSPSSSLYYNVCNWRNTNRLIQYKFLFILTHQTDGKWQTMNELSRFVLNLLENGSGVIISKWNAVLCTVSIKHNNLFIHKFATRWN